MADRAQLYTLEGIAAGLVIILGLFFALQATIATPGAAGSLNPHAEQQDRATVQGTLNAMNDSTLRQAVLYWNESAETFHDAGSQGFYTIGTPSATDCDIDETDDPNPPTQFGHALCQQFGQEYNYNVVVSYNDSGGLGQQRVVFQGQPGNGAVKRVASVVLTNDQRLYDDGDDINSPSGETLSDSTDTFYAPPSDGDAADDDLYNVLYVEVTVWR